MERAVKKEDGPIITTATFCMTDWRSSEALKGRGRVEALGNFTQQLGIYKVEKGLAKV